MLMGLLYHFEASSCIELQLHQETTLFNVRMFSFVCLLENETLCGNDMEVIEKQ